MTSSTMWVRLGSLSKDFKVTNQEEVFVGDNGFFPEVFWLSNTTLIVKFCDADIRNQKNSYLDQYTNKSIEVVVVNRPSKLVNGIQVCPGAGDPSPFFPSYQGG